MEIGLVQNISEKNPNVSFARFIALCFIVMCHILQYFGYELAWWLNVGVQMFLFISGFLYGNKNIDDPINFIKKNFKKIIVPYYCFLLPVVLLYFLFSRENLSFKIVIKALFCSQTIRGLEHLWFVSYILFCYFITPYLFFLKKKLRILSKVKFSLFFLLVFAFGHTLFSLFDSYFSFDKIFCYLCGYFAAVFWDSYGFKMFKSVSNLVVVIAVFVNALRVLCKYFWHFYFSNFDLFETYCHTILGVALVLVIVIYVKIKPCWLFEFSDKNSYYIYIVHQLFILSPFTLLTATENIFVNLFLMIISIVFSALVLCRVSSKIKK